MRHNQKSSLNQQGFVEGKLTRAAQGGKVEGLLARLRPRTLNLVLVQRKGAKDAKTQRRDYAFFAPLPHFASLR
jgi:hypothetical protein